MKNIIIPLFFAVLAALHAGGSSSTVKTRIERESRIAEARIYEQRAEECLTSVWRWNPKDPDWERKKEVLHCTLTLLNNEASRVRADFLENGESERTKEFNKKMTDLEVEASAMMREYRAWSTATGRK